MYTPVIVGTPVHYYTQNPDEQSNGQGMGPYYGVVTQVFGGSDYANLMIFAPFKQPYHAGSVSVREAAFDAMTGTDLPYRWYEAMQVKSIVEVELPPAFQDAMDKLDAAIDAVTDARGDLNGDQD